ncbi:MAG: sigma 54-interacting transcriptional regulator [Nitrospirota bacterium]
MTPLERKVQELTCLYEVARALATSLDIRETSSEVLRILGTVLGTTRGALALHDPGTDDLVITAAYGLTDEEMARGRFKPTEGVTGAVFTAGEPMIVPDLGKEPLFLNRTQSRADLSKLALVAVPVQAQGETLGVLSVDRPAPDPTVSLDEDVRVLTVVASLIGQAAKLQRVVDDERRKLEAMNLSLQHQLQAKYRSSPIVGRSPAMVEVFEAIEKVGGSRATVLLLGESGTGKELIARAVHYNSPQADGPFVTLNCAALPENLIESELFGHEKGAFTGATALRKGRFELADGGTLFLDEIGELPLAMQSKLLRVLQERTFERVGGNRPMTVQVRLIAATNRDLERAVAEGSFREDLYYRLKVVPIRVPPLRERKEDIPLLVDHFLKRLRQEHQKPTTIMPDALARLVEHHWPGNVRELENTLERMVIMGRQPQITLQDVIAVVGERRRSSSAGAEGDASLTSSVEELERQQIVKAMEEAKGVQAKAAKSLGITPRQLGYRLRKYGLAS